MKQNNCCFLIDIPRIAWYILFKGKHKSIRGNDLNSKSILSIRYPQIDEYRNGARLIHGELFQGRGQSFGLEYQYDADSLHYGAQLIISYADGIKFRHLNRSVWSDWEQISAAPLP